jgi:hypothetical protein
MNHFNSKSLIFYGVAIGSVLLLFKIVTTYGEKNLQASAVLNSRYRINWTQNLPNCQQSEPLTLDIQQSGIYLNAFLVPTNATTDKEKRLYLTGILKNQQLNLKGKIDQAILCDIAPPKSIQAQMQLVDQGHLQGQLIISSISQTLEFNATPEAAQAPSKNLNSH